MAQQTVCDCCKSGEPLDPKTGMYQVVVSKVTKVHDDGGKSLTETEYDVCGACMAQIREVPKK